jgi:hypothetical protein
MICGGLIAMEKISRAVMIERVITRDFGGLQWTDAATRQYRSGMRVLLAEGSAGAIALWCGLTGIIVSLRHRVAAETDRKSAQPGQPG